MASASFSFVAPPLASANSLLHGRATLAFPSSSHSASWSSRTRRGHLRLLAQGADLLGDFGARDPFPEEIESNFCEKVLGNTDTMHRILIPNISALSLAQMSCEPISSSQPPISTEDAEKLLKKVTREFSLREIPILKYKGFIFKKIFSLGSLRVEEPWGKAIQTLNLSLNTKELSLVLSQFYRDSMIFFLL